MQKCKSTLSLTKIISGIVEESEVEAVLDNNDRKRKRPNIAFIFKEYLAAKEAQEANETEKEEEEKGKQKKYEAEGISLYNSMSEDIL